MTKKKGIIFETLGSVQNLAIQESKNPDEMILSGVFGVCGVRNGNNRIYEKSNYGKMVNILKEQITNEGVLGELEHPNTMNITLENVSHKIEDIVMQEDGTVTGTIKLLNTPKGKIAKAIIEGGAPLYISSRGAGSIDESGHVTLTTIKTYDLVGTPGFSQARMTLAGGQKLESLNESLETPCWMIVESEEDDDLLNGDKKDDKKEDSKDNKDTDNKEDDITMKDIKNSVDELTKKVEQLESELHITKENLKETENDLNEAKNKEINYEAIQTWIEEEFAPSLKNSIEEKINENATEVKEYVNNIYSAKLQEWITEEFAPSFQKWITEEYTPSMQEEFANIIAPAIQKWVTEEYSGTLQNWITEEFAGTVQNWINEEYSNALQNWITEEYSGTLQNWITEEFAGDMNKNISEFLESQKNDKFAGIDKMLEALSDKTKANENAQKILEQQQAEKYNGIPAIENMPTHMRPIWEGLSDEKKERIVRESRMYDFTKPGSLERFWESRKLTSDTILEDRQEQKTVQQPITENKYSKIFAQAKKMQH